MIKLSGKILHSEYLSVFRNIKGFMIQNIHRWFTKNSIARYFKNLFRNILHIITDKFSYLRGKKLDYKILETMPCIFLEGNTSTRTFTDEYLEARGVKVEPEFELATSDMIVQFALRNLGIGCVVEDFAAEKLETGELFCLEFEDEMPMRQMCIVIDKRSPMSPAGRKLLDMMMDGSR